jgi:ABC-type sugar transport system permease subunit
MNHNKITPYLFVLPTIVGLLVFRLGPVVVAAAASFTRWNVQTPPQFLGLNNYSEFRGVELRADKLFQY